MKTLVLLLCLPLLANAQRKPRVSLTIQSVTVWLGMPKAEALSSLASVGLSTVGSSDMLMIKNQNNKFVGGTIEFKNGYLTYADRNWPVSNSSELEAVIDAFESLTSGNTPSCQIQSAPIAEPEHKARRIFIDCGERSILLMRGSLFGEVSSLYSQVSERIGHLQPEKAK